MATPVSIERFVKELEKLKAEIDADSLKHSEYDQRLARVITELRERGLDGDRAKVTAALDDAARRGVITASVKLHLVSKLGLA
jgi:hypothetical protein